MEAPAGRAMLAAMSSTASEHPPQATDAAPRRRRGRLLLLVAVAALVVLGVIVAVAAGRRPQPATAGAAPDTPPRLGEGAPLVGERLPAVTLPPLADLGPAGGLTLPVADGEPMVVNFWASWCAPCIDEMPMLQRVSDDLGVALVGVDYVDPQEDEAVALARELGITYPLVVDELGEYGERVGLFGTPTTLIVDGDGIVRRQLTGELTEDQLRSAVDAARSPPSDASGRAAGWRVPDLIGTVAVGLRRGSPRLNFHRCRGCPGLGDATKGRQG